MADESAIVIRKYPVPTIQLAFWKKESVERIYINRKLGAVFRDFAYLEHNAGNWTFKVVARGDVERTCCRDLKVQNVQEIPQKFFSEEIKKYLK
ncbi:MAG: hypothetical protein HY555_02620 [Euryarchaeota archaeon]|nr:hypothetical protein [Euryarchaeota archaeon]